MGLGQQIKKHRAARGWTLEQLSEKSGVDTGTISALENRESQRSKYASDIAKGFGLTTDQLLDDATLAIRNTAPAPGQRTPIDLSNNPDYPAVRRVQFKLSAGASGFGVDYLGEDDPPIVFKRAWFESNGYRPEALFAVRVANGSMEPGLYDGDTVVVNTGQTEPKDGKVFAVNYEGELVIKRLVRDAGQWWLCSDNPDQRHYPRKQAHAGAILLGEIVHKQSERI